MENKTLLGEDDGLLIPDDLGPWTEDKLDLIRNYCQIFSSAMKNKWTRAYVDLYAGSGLCRIEGRREVLLGSPLIALSVDVPFDSYVFCESDPDRFSALKARVEKSYSHLNTKLIPGKFEEHIDEICSRIPAKSLALCFVDPFDCDFNIDDLKTISRSAHGVDFLCLLALQMDAKRNVERYLTARQQDRQNDREYNVARAMEQQGRYSRGFCKVSCNGIRKEHVRGRLFGNAVTPDERS